MVLRLFIIEPLENFDHNVESDLDVTNIRSSGFAVKRNIFGDAPPIPGPANLEWCA
ncbi:hypothetical protein [Agromyces kandeliae]|uniref:Uncharacterized protein n=1 Tax=Agromyces kandeliae TaxID=2666141 RepID=A0A6L5R4S6_9MICO|nr:hypothetical protein [Agromyces kandeliae]MRX44594.1 hypothetical protein [Agromyces kandeliae]